MESNSLHISSITCPNCGENLFTNDIYLVCSNGLCGAWGRKIEKNKKKDYMEERDESINR
jgi:hypothetical protein